MTRGTTLKHFDVQGPVGPHSCDSEVVAGAGELTAGGKARWKVKHRGQAGDPMKILERYLDIDVIAVDIIRYR